MSEAYPARRVLSSKGIRARNIRRIIKKVAIWVAIISAVIGVFVLIGSGASSNQAATKAASGAVQGEMAPDFSLPSTMDTTYTLSSFKDKQNVLIYFHEGATCDPCMQQMPELDKDIPQYDKMNVKLLYVAFDSPNEMKKASARYKLRTPVLSYANAKTDQDYDLVANSMGMERRAGHTFVLVGMDGKILWRKDYYVGRGMSGPKSNTMFVKGSEILSEVQGKLGGKQ